MQIFTGDGLLITILVEDAIIEFINLKGLLGNVALNLFVGYAVGCSHSEGVSDEPVVYNTLGSRYEFVCSFRTDLQPD
jgi:hypothetical protein